MRLLVCVSLRGGTNHKHDRSNFSHAFRANRLCSAHLSVIIALNLFSNGDIHDMRSLSASNLQLQFVIHSEVTVHTHFVLCTSVKITKGTWIFNATFVIFIYLFWLYIKYAKLQKNPILWTMLCFYYYNTAISLKINKVAICPSIYPIIQ